MQRLWWLAQKTHRAQLKGGSFGKCGFLQTSAGALYAVTFIRVVCNRNCVSCAWILARCFTEQLSLPIAATADSAAFCVVRHRCAFSICFCRGRGVVSIRARCLGRPRRRARADCASITRRDWPCLAGRAERAASKMAYAPRKKRKDPSSPKPGPFKPGCPSKCWVTFSLALIIVIIGPGGLIPGVFSVAQFGRCVCGHDAR